MFGAASVIMVGRGKTPQSFVANSVIKASCWPQKGKFNSIVSINSEAVKANA